MAAKLEINVTRSDDLEDAIETVLNKVREGYTSGSGMGFYWNIEDDGEEPDDEEDEPDEDDFDDDGDDLEDDEE